MPIAVDVYTAEAVVRGVLDRPGPLREVLETEPLVTIGRASVQRLDGRPVEIGPPVELATEDVAVAAAAADGTILPAHATWHELRLEIGPYLVTGEFPTPPGFDPGRALSRPTGDFVVLRDVRVSLLGRPDAGEARHAMAAVQRYAVERIAADLILGVFFPGARIDPVDSRIGVS